MAFNVITPNEKAAAEAVWESMSEGERDQLMDALTEKKFEVQAAFGPGYEIAPAKVDGTNETVPMHIYEIAYRARISKLFEERDDVDA